MINLNGTISGLSSAQQTVAKKMLDSALSNLAMTAAIGADIELSLLVMLVVGIIKALEPKAKLAEDFNLNDQYGWANGLRVPLDVLLSAFELPIFNRDGLVWST